MTKENITFRLDTEKRRALDAIAAGIDRDRSYVLNEAIALYLDLHQWQVAEIQQGIAEADAEDFAPDAEVQTVFAELTQPIRTTPKNRGSLNA
jgi:predicted transcriptional regulator